MALTSDVALLGTLAAEAHICEAREAFRFVACGDSGMPTEDRQQAQRSRSPAPGAPRGAAQVSAHRQQAMQGGQPQLLTGVWRSTKAARNARSAAALVLPLRLTDRTIPSKSRNLARASQTLSSCQVLIFP